MLSRRQEIAELIQDLGHEQRRPGGVLENTGELLLPNLGFCQIGVKRNFNINSEETEKKRRRCGSCNLLGHNGKTCSKLLIRKIMRRKLKQQL